MFNVYKKKNYVCQLISYIFSEVYLYLIIIYDKYDK